jgi:hypothetical protein
MDNSVKFCRKCETYHDISEFKYGKSSCYTCQKEMARLWKEKNKEKVHEYNKKYKENNKETIKEYNRDYHNNNREDIKKRSLRNYKRLLKENPSFKLGHLLRSYTRKFLKKNKSVATSDLLGCSLEFFKEWLSFNFKEDMTFDNHGTCWHIDHLIPCSRFNLVDEQEQRRCFHWTNMKPMYAHDNIKKGNKTDIDEILNHEEHLERFLGIKRKTNHQNFTLLSIDRKSYIKNII